jgi:hypothetical protein
MATEQTQRLFERLRGVFHVAAFECQFAQLAFDLSSVEATCGDRRRAFKELRGRVVAAPEHEHVA